MEEYPAYSSFRSLLSKWDESLNKEKVAAALNNENLCFFFSFDGHFYGATEETRLAFARMKNPDDEDKGWITEASFAAIDLSRASEGEQTEKLFKKSDVDNIKIMTKEEVEKKLLK